MNYKIKSAVKADTPDAIQQRGAIFHFSQKQINRSTIENFSRYEK